MKKILFLFLVALMLVSCDSPVQENDNEEQTNVETVTEETKAEETAETKEPVEEIKPEEKKPQEETKKQAAEETVEETKEEPVETEVTEQPEEVVEPEEPQETVEEPVEETPVEQPVEEPTEEVVEEPVEEQPEEIIEQPVIVDPWVKINYTDGDFGIPYFAVPKGYEPTVYSYYIPDTEERCDFPMVKFERVNRRLTHKKSDRYKDTTLAFWKYNPSDNKRYFQAEIEVYKVSVSSDFEYDSLLLIYNDLYMSNDSSMKIGYILTKENGEWYIRSATQINLYNYLPEKDDAKYTAKVLSYYN